MRVFIIFTFLFSLNSWSNCEIDLSASGQSMHQMEPMNQGSSDLCYAYTYAQMVDAYRFSQGATNSGAATRLSPTMIALENTLLFENSEGQRTLLARSLEDPRFGFGEGGLINEVHNTFVAQGGCPMSIDETFEQQNSSHPLNELIDHIESNNLIQEDSQDRTAFCHQALDIYQDVVGNLDLKGILTLVDRLYLGDRIRRNYCQTNRIRFTGATPTLVQTSAVPDYIDRSVNRLRSRTENFYAENLANLDRGLCDQRQPVSIEYCSQMASDPNFRSMNEFGQDFAGVENPPIPQVTSKELNGDHTRGPAPHLCGEGSQMSEGKHVSAIIGRRVRAGRVQYLLRNTYGNYCSNQFEANCVEAKDHWIDAERVAANVSQMSWLVPPTN